MVRIWRFSRQKRCFKSDTRMTKSVTLTARPELQGLQGAVDVLTEKDTIVVRRAAIRI